MNRLKGENMTPLKSSLVLLIVKKKSTKIDKTKPATPPSLLGIERKIA
jgi:hypothetical protein